MTALIGVEKTTKRFFASLCTQRHIQQCLCDIKISAQEAREHSESKAFLSRSSNSVGENPFSHLQISKPTHMHMGEGLYNFPTSPRLSILIKVTLTLVWCRTTIIILENQCISKFLGHWPYILCHIPCRISKSPLSHKKAHRILVHQIHSSYCELPDVI